MNICDELVAGNTIDISKTNIRFFVLKHKNGFEMFFHDPQYVVPLLKNIDDINFAKSICMSPGYRPFADYVIDFAKDMKMLFKDNNIHYSAPSLEALQKNVDTNIIGHKNDEGIEHTIDVSTLELFDIDDPDAIAKACS